MSTAYDLATYIAVTLGKGTLGTDVFVNGIVESINDQIIDNQIVVYEYGGSPSSLAMGSADAGALEHPSCQVLVRDKDPGAAWTKIYAIYKALDGFIDVTINGSVYLFMRAMQPPFVLGRDQSERISYAFNLEIQKRRS